MGAATAYAGEMRYLVDHRAEVRNDPRRLLPSAKSILCVGKLYDGPQPESPEMAAISRYAWGAGLSRRAARGPGAAGGADAAGGRRMRLRMEDLRGYGAAAGAGYARHAGLGWIGKNTCLISQEKGSWFFLGELLLSLELAADAPPPDRCGTCTRCIDACPTAAIVPAAPPGPAWTIDSRLCISYFTIELRGPIPAESREGIGANVFGCDICQDVCPWNRRTKGRRNRPCGPPPLEKLAALSEEEFRTRVPR